MRLLGIEVREGEYLRGLFVPQSIGKGKEEVRMSARVCTAEGTKELAMARRATHLSVMAVVRMSMLLGPTAGALSQAMISERLLRAD